MPKSTTFYKSIASPLDVKVQVCDPHFNNTVQKTNLQDPLQAEVQAATRIELAPTAPTVIPTIQADAVALGFARSDPKLRSHQPHTPPPLPFIDRSKTGKERLVDEFAASGISREMTLLNAQWIDGDPAIEILCEDAIAKVQSNTSYLTEPAKRIRDRYDYIWAGGWFAYGTTLDGSQGLVAYVKPDEPRLDFEGKKRVKYETPQGCPALPILPFMDQEHAEEIFERFKVTPLEGETFWQTILRSNCPVAFVEGLKKALSVIEQGIPAIALRGFTQWSKKGGSELHDAIAQFATCGRKIYIFFDEDAKPQTLEQAHKQRLKLGTALESKGCHVFLPRWDTTLGKGIDDALVGLGADAQVWFDDLLRDAGTLKQAKRAIWIVKSVAFLDEASKLSYPVERATAGAYMPALPDIGTGEIIIIAADMNSGKSTQIAVSARQKKAEGWNILHLSGTNNLGRQGAADLNVPHMHDFDGQVGGQARLAAAIEDMGGISLCPDSQPKLPPDFFDGPVLIVLDEGNEICSHVTQGNTTKGRYAEIVELFGAGLQKAIENGAIIVSEAGLPDRAVNLIKTLSGGEIVRVFTHEKEVEPWQVTAYKGQASGFHARFLEAMADGGKRVFVTSSQREAARIERALKKRYPSKKVVRVDSQTNRNGDLNELFQDPNNWLKTEQPDVLILSPSARSGVSIEGAIAKMDAYFCEVWGYFANLGTDTHMQLLGRYRPSVPRVVFCPEVIMDDSGDDLYPRAFARKEKSHTKTLGFALGLDEVLTGDGDRAARTLEIEGAIAKYLSIERAVVAHQKRMAYLELVRQLENAGHNVTCETLKKDADAAKLWEEIGTELDQEKAAFLAVQTVETQHTPEWARLRLNSQSCSLEDEALAHKVLWGEKFPGVAFDDADQCYRMLFQKYGSMARGVEQQGRIENLDASEAIDRHLAQLILGKDVRAFHRLPREAMKTKILEKLGLLAFMDGQEYGNDDPRAIALKKMAMLLKKAIATYLHLHVQDWQTPVEIVNKLIKRLGVKAIAACKRGSRGQQKTIYQVEGHDDPLRVKLLEAYRRRLSEMVSVISSKENIYLEITDTTPLTPEEQGLWGAEEVADIAKMWSAATSEEERSRLRLVAPSWVIQKVLSDWLAA